jgi:myosin heavy chain 9/10/11/14
MQRRLAKKRLYRQEAAIIIQRNLKAFADLQSDPWWQLYTKMKPLVTASRAAEEEKAKKAAVAAMEARIAEEKKHTQKLEEERQRIEAEKARIEEALLSERALAADTQEILRRSKEKQQEMEDQLESFMAELEEADNNYDKLMDSFAESQRTVERMRSELTIGAQLVQKLQEEKLELLEEIEEVSREIGTEKVIDEEHLEKMRHLYCPPNFVLMIVRRRLSV